MERLWSPWRLEYVTRGDTSSECIFCVGTTQGSPLQRDLIVFEGTTAYVILNLYPYNNGHLMVVPYRHVATLGELTDAELQEIGMLTQRSEAALTEAYQPHGMNIGINLGKSAGAGILEHVHVHVVPRWSGDTNFMTVVGEMRVLPEDLGASAARLRPIFARLASRT
ncbi:MAG: HIT domain-containing protein [Acidobacteria bacterium]|nr:HIT domain-containing protein [Acidobacteriota bacterium]